MTLSFVHPPVSFGSKWRGFMGESISPCQVSKHPLHTAVLQPTRQGDTTANSYPVQQRPMSLRRMMNRTIRTPLLNLPDTKEKKNVSNQAEKPKKPKRSTGKRVGKKGYFLKRTGMNTAVVLSKELQQFLGVKEDMMIRAQVSALLNKYIRSNGLSLKENRRRFTCNDELEKLFNVTGQFDGRQVLSLLRSHLQKPQHAGPEYEERAKKMFDDYLKEKGAKNRGALRETIDPRGRNSVKAQAQLRLKGMGMYSDVKIAPRLRSICGGKDRMSRPQVLKAVWDYIKRNQLQNPKNKRKIMVSEDLKKALAIVDKEEIDCFHVTCYVCKLLSKIN